MSTDKKFLEGIRVISFDVGFTLIYPDPPVGEVYASAAARFGYRLSGQDVHDRFKKTWKKKRGPNPNREKETVNALSSEEGAYRWWQEIFQESIGDVLAPGDLERVFNACFEEYAKGKYWKMYPEVYDTLTALRSRGFRLVVLSNWDRRLLRTLRDLGIDGFFDKIYISTQIGFAKPDPLAFRYIIDDLGVPVSVLLHVGDTLEEDISGARQAGIRSVCIDRRGKYKSMHYPDQVCFISSLAELAD